MQRRLFFYLLAWLWPLVGQAAGTSVLVLPQSNGPAHSISGSHSLTLQNSQYLGANKPAFAEGAARENSSVSLRLDDRAQWSSHTRAELKLKDEWSGSEHWNYLDVHQANLQYSADRIQVSAGRKLESWSTWDDGWQQGEFQPRYMENRMRPEAAGLTGIFVTTTALKPVTLTVAALPLFIPDFVAHFSVNEDHFTSKNPWFHAPASKFLFRGTTGDIHYRLIPPPVAEILNHRGVATKLEWQRRNYLLRASYAYKPMPAMILGFPSDHRYMLSPTSDFMAIDVTPKVIYNRIVSVDGGLKRGPYSFSASVTLDNPVQDPFPDDWTAQQVRPAQIYAASVACEVGGHTVVRAGFLRVNGGDAPNTGRFAGDETLFERRFQFTDAYMLSLEREFYKLKTEVQALYDRLQDGGTVRIDAGADLAANLRVQMQLDFIGLISTKPPVVDGFVETYRANNRFGLGLAYVF